MTTALNWAKLGAMCYSAIVIQNLKKLGLKFDAKVDYLALEELFERRLEDSSIKITKALEANFTHPENKHEQKIKKWIDAYKEKKSSELEAELFKQKKRLADAERKLSEKETKKALEEQRISSNKIQWNLSKLADLKREKLEPQDSRIFPMMYAPIIINEKNERVIKLARYHCRPEGQPASIDFKFNGLYNARRDNLNNAFWKNLFGHKHAFFVIESFYENVARHDYEKRKLHGGEEPENIVLHFNPQHRGEDMLVACLYDHWGKSGTDGFYSFAAITGEPTPEVAATGHERLIISLKGSHLDSWLSPQGQTKEQLYAILDDPAQFRYEHELAG
jgi:putative SOS response-associated peptidase YedK